MSKKPPRPPSGGDWTPGELAGVLGNPFNAINLHESLFGPHEHLVDEERWIALNVKLIDQLGAEAWLRNLLAGLKNGPLGGRHFGYDADA
jgi:hypothetical protein